MKNISSLAHFGLRTTLGLGKEKTVLKHDISSLLKGKFDPPLQIISSRQTENKVKHMQLYDKVSLAKYSYFH
jgi:hypothetical protein